MPEDHILFEQTCNTARIKPAPLSEFFSCGYCAKKNRFCDFFRSKTCFFILAIIGLLALLALLSLLRRARGGNCIRPEIKEDKLVEKDLSTANAMDSCKIPIKSADNLKEERKKQEVVVCKSHKRDERANNCVKRRVKCKSLHKKESKTDLRKYHNQLCEIVCKDQKDSDEYLFKEANIVPLNPLEMNFFTLSEDLKKTLDDIKVKSANFDVICSSEELLSIESSSNSCLEQDSRTLLKENICKIEKGLTNLTAKVDTLVKCGVGNEPTRNHVKDESKTKLVLKIEYLEETIKQMEEKFKSMEDQTKTNENHPISENENEIKSLKSDQSLKKELAETIENIGKELLKINEKSKIQQKEEHHIDEDKNAMMKKEQVEELFQDLRTMLEKYFPDKISVDVRAPDVKDGFDVKIYKENIEKIAKLSDQLEMCSKEIQNLQSQLDKDKINGRNIIKPNEPNLQKNTTSIEDTKKDDAIDTRKLEDNQKLNKNSLNEILDRDINENFEKYFSETKNQADVKEFDTKNSQTLEKEIIKKDLNNATDENGNKNKLDKDLEKDMMDNLDQVLVKKEKSDTLEKNMETKLMENLEKNATDENKKRNKLDKDLEKDMMDNLDQVLVKKEKTHTLDKEMETKLMENLEKNATDENRNNLDKDLEIDMIDELDQVLGKEEKPDTLEKEMETKLMENLEKNGTEENRNRKKLDKDLEKDIIIIDQLDQGIVKEEKTETLEKEMETKLMENLEKNTTDENRDRNNLDKDIETDIIDQLDQGIVKEENTDTLEKEMETKLMENLEKNATDENRKNQQEPSVTLFITELREDLSKFLNKHFEADANQGIEGQSEQSEISFTSMDQMQLDLIEDIEGRLGLETEDTKTETPSEKKKNWLKRKMPKMPNIGKLFPKPKSPKTKEFMQYYP